MNGDFTDKLTGYALSAGKFYNEDDRSLAIGAPKDKNYKGSVYICYKCFVKKRFVTKVSKVFITVFQAGVPPAVVPSATYTYINFELKYFIGIFSILSLASLVIGIQKY